MSDYGFDCYEGAVTTWNPHTLVKDTQAELDEDRRRHEDSILGMPVAWGDSTSVTSMTACLKLDAVR